jgi:Ni,Fe-hydrogenase III small subunit
MAEQHEKTTKVLLTTPEYALGVPAKDLLEKQSATQLVIAKDAPALSFGYFRNVRAVYPHLEEVVIISPEVTVTQPTVERVLAELAFAITTAINQLEEQ